VTRFIVGQSMHSCPGSGAPSHQGPGYGRTETRNSPFPFEYANLVDIFMPLKPLPVPEVKTRLDVLLDRVKPREHEVTIDAEGYTKEQVKRIIAGCKKKRVERFFRW
jgi:hypothetical protein